MNKQNTCCNLCYGRMGTTAGGGIYCNNPSCACHTQQASAKNDKDVDLMIEMYNFLAKQDNNNKEYLDNWLRTGILRLIATPKKSAKSDMEVVEAFEKKFGTEDGYVLDFADEPHTTSTIGAWLLQALATQRERYKDEALKQYGMGQQEGIKYARESMQDNRKDITVALAEYKGSMRKWAKKTTSDCKVYHNKQIDNPDKIFGFNFALKCLLEKLK